MFFVYREQCFIFAKRAERHSTGEFQLSVSSGKGKGYRSDRGTRGENGKEKEKDVMETHRGWHHTTHWSRMCDGGGGARSLEWKAGDDLCLNFELSICYVMLNLSLSVFIVPIPTCKMEKITPFSKSYCKN